MTSFEEKPKKELSNFSSPGSEAERRKDLAEDAQAESSEAREKRKTIAHLIESGRAKTPEDAERYLESLNRLKDKLLQFARELAQKQIHEPNTFPEDGMVRYAFRRAQESDLKRIATLRIDEIDPNVWYLDRKVSSSYPHGSYSLANRLTVKTLPGLVEIDFGPDGNTATKLKQQLSNDELELLRKEHEFANQDLAKQLRLQADMISNPRTQRHLTEDRALGALFEKEATA